MSSKKMLPRYYLCTDSSGVSIGTSRVVEVGCEGPNPTGALAILGSSGGGPHLGYRG